MNFLKKIHKEKKLKLVEPSQEITSSYLEKSDSSHSSAKLLYENKHYEEAIAMTYYSMYHALTALLRKTGIKCENHAAAIKILKKIYQQENKELIQAKKQRINTQYYTNTEINKEEVKKLITKAETFKTKTYETISKLKNEDIKNYREKLKEIIN